MDNLSHSLAGLMVGELIERRLPPEPDTATTKLRRRMLLITAWLAANFSDLDLLLTRLLPAPLGYLLHHRGHTHTVVFALAQALGLMLLVWLLWPAARRLLATSPSARRGLLAAAWLGMATHLLLDYLNSYGLHPFYPYMRWFYGDMIFILEPVFWFAFGIPLIAILRPSKLKCVLLCIPLVFLVWALTKQYLHWISAVGLIVIAGALLHRQFGAPWRSRRSLGAGVAIAVLFVTIQAGASFSAREMLTHELQQLDPGSRMLDAALSPLPSNPACWTYASVELTGNAYRLRRGMLSIAPGVMPLPDCPGAFRVNMWLYPSQFSVEWEASTPLVALHKRARDCHVAAWLRFARVPLIEDTMATDVRFSSHDNFTSLLFAQFAGKPCPANVPGWDLPRRDLFEANQ